jgi:transcriptional regulator with XRE-family HTH domain
MENFPLKLRMLREKLGMSQKEFGNKIGEKQQNVNYQEHSKKVSVNYIKKIIEAFDFSEHAFLFGTVEDIVNPTKNFVEKKEQNPKERASSVDINYELKQAKFEAEFYKNRCEEKITHIEKSISKISSSFDVLIHLLGIGQHQETIKDEGSGREAEIHRARRLIQPKPKPIPHDP